MEKLTGNSYENLMGKPIDPDETFYKDGSKVEEGVDGDDRVLAENARMANMSKSEKRYL